MNVFDMLFSIAVAIEIFGVVWVLMALVLLGKYSKPEQGQIKINEEKLWIGVAIIFAGMILKGITHLLLSVVNSL